MIGGIQLKVCGITSLVDADAADAIGADYLGFILHPNSPRRISLEQLKAMFGRLPPRKKVGVVVEPTQQVLRQILDAGFDAVQIHFTTEISTGSVESWASEVGAERLWLAPKLPPGRDIPEEILPLARTFLLDTYDPKLFGGTGRTGDWEKYRKHKGVGTQKTWILSGGLGPENVALALRETGARFIDVNSGVEAAPGVKDHSKLKQLAANIRDFSKNG